MMLWRIVRQALPAADSLELLLPEGETGPAPDGGAEDGDEPAGVDAELVW